MKAKIIIPENLSEVTLAQYAHFLKVAEGCKGDLLKQRMVEHFCNVELSNVLLIKLSDVRDICDHIDALFSIDKPLIERFEIKGVQFGFIPSLDDMTFGEYIDLDKYITDWEYMHRAMAVLYRPIIADINGQYQIAEYNGTDEYAEIMKLSPLDAVLGAVVFFYHLGRELLTATRHYLMDQIREEISQSLDSSILNGDGIQAYINSLEAMLEGSMKLLEFDSHKPLII